VTASATVTGSFLREQLRTPLALVLLVAIPAFFVLIFATVLGEFSKALGGTLASSSATAISAGWAAAFLSGALVLVGLIYGAIGTLAGALLDKLAATYLILFLVMADLGVVQTPMFHAAPSRLAVLLPGYAPTRLMLDGAYSQTFTATAELLLAIGWVVALAATVYFVLRRRLGTTSHSPSIIYPVRVCERS